METKPSLRGRGHAAAAAAAAQSSGRSYNSARLFTLNAGEQALVRFRACVRETYPESAIPDIRVDGLPVGIPQTAKEIMRFPLRKLASIVRQLGLSTMVLEDRPQGSRDGERREIEATPQQLAERIAEFMATIEPCTVGEHFIANNKGEGRRTYIACGKDWGMECVPCELRDSSDNYRKFINSANPRTNFTVVPGRMYHYDKPDRQQRGRGRGAEDDKAEFVYCTNYGYDATNDCEHCRRGSVAKQEGAARFPLAGVHVEGLFAAFDRISRRCAACQGSGKIDVVGYACRKCGEPMEQPPSAGMKVSCHECGWKDVPYDLLSCSKGCKSPRRGQAYDTDILIQRLGDAPKKDGRGGSKGGSKTAYSFAEQFPFEPPSAAVARYMPLHMEDLLKPGTSDEQTGWLGERVNPYTGKPPTGRAPRSGRSEPDRGKDDRRPGRTDDDADSQVPDADVPY